MVLASGLLLWRILVTLSMSRCFVLAGALCALAFAASACSEDNSLVDLGGDVQSTRVAQATFDAKHATPSPIPTPQPTPTAEPQLVVDLRAVGSQALEIDRFFNFLQIRITGSDTLTAGSIGGEDGLLEEGWIEECCERQWSSVQQSIVDTGATLLDLQGEYEEQGLAEQLALVSTARGQLDEAQAILDEIATAPSLDQAAVVTSAGRSIAGRLIETVGDLTACCEPLPTSSTEEPSP